MYLSIYCSMYCKQAFIHLLYLIKELSTTKQNELVNDCANQIPFEVCGIQCLQHVSSFEANLLISLWYCGEPKSQWIGNTEDIANERGIM